MFTRAKRNWNIPTTHSQVMTNYVAYVIAYNAYYCRITSPFTTAEQWLVLVSANNQQTGEIVSQPALFIISNYMSTYHKTRQLSCACHPPPHSSMQMRIKEAHTVSTGNGIAGISVLCSEWGLIFFNSYNWRQTTLWWLAASQNTDSSK